MEKNRKGFTLIEIVIVLGLTGIVVSMIFSPMIFSYNSFATQSEKTNIVSNARTTMDYLTRQIRKSNEIEVDDNTIVMDSNIYKLEDRTIFKDNKKVAEGIDELIVNMVNKTINIEIVIRDRKGKDYRLSSIINIR